MISIRTLKRHIRSFAALFAALLVPTALPASDASAPHGSSGPGAEHASAQAGPEASTTRTAPVAITQPLSPTAVNIFNFGPHAFKVQYPPGSSFSGVYMTVTAVPISQAAFSARVAGTAFANSICLVYGSELGNCIDYQVTCTNAAPRAVACPASAASNIALWTSFDTTQLVINPGLLSTEIGMNAWGNTFDFYSVQNSDPTAHGHTKGWSEFVAVAVGVTNKQGLGEFAFNAPLLATDPRTFAIGSPIPIGFHLTSVENCGQPVSDASAGLTVTQIANAQGQLLSSTRFAQESVFRYSAGNYSYSLSTENLPAGTYVMTVFGDAFVTQSTYFTLQ
jgi:hypothetical protein